MASNVNPNGTNKRKKPVKPVPAPAPPTWQEENQTRAQHTMDSLYAMGQDLLDARAREDADEEHPEGKTVEDCEQAIQEDPLEVVWTWRGNCKREAELHEGEILVSFGGPNARIVGRVNDDNCIDATRAELRFHWSGEVIIPCAWDKREALQAYLDLFPGECD